VGLAGEDMRVRPGGSSSLPRVALVGRTNVGKSTLFNRLVRGRRSLVEDSPGVTRDRVAWPARFEGRDVLLVDTGGLDPGAESGIPEAVNRQVQSVVADAAVIVLVVSARDGLLPLDRQIAQLLRRATAPVIVAANKADAPSLEVAAAEFSALGFDELVPVSAEHRLGIPDLEIAIAERLPAEVEPAAADENLRIALVGRPNVGKSSLLNRLLGESHAIVSDQPGTTRDASDTQIQVGDRPVVLIDTAGMRRAARRTDRLERGSAYQSLRAIERAHVAVLLLDASEAVTDQDARIARMALDRGRVLILALNKWDTVLDAGRRKELRRELDRRLGFVPEAAVLQISARTGKGTHRVLPTAIELADAAHRKISTAELNRALRAALESHAPPASGRQRPRFFYATQTSEFPLTVLIFVNDPAFVPRGYRRYLEGALREQFDLRSTSLRLRLRARRRAGDGRGRGAGHDASDLEEAIGEA
jgi:GTPase